MKIGVVDVGGGMRGIYAAGVFDRCLEQGIQFDVCVGVSAGAANIASYLAGQRRRNYLFYTEYAFRKRYMGAGNFLRRRSYIDLDYVYGGLSDSDGENPLDFRAMIDNPAELVVVACDARTGEARYFGKNDIGFDSYDIFKASCAIPFVCRPYEVGGVPCYDGALGDPVPVEKAFALGCDKVVVILSKPVDVPRVSGSDRFFADRIEWEYPKAAAGLRLRAKRYNEGVEAARRYADEGRALILAPDDLCGLDTLTKDRAALRRFYRKGLRDAWPILDFCRG